MTRAGAGFGLGVAALALAFTALLATHHAPGFPLDGADEGEYLESCRSLALRGRLAVRPVDAYQFVSLNRIEGIDGAYHGKHPAGLVFLCAAAWKALGPLAPYWISPLLAILAVLGMAGFGRTIAGAGGGLVAAALLAANPVHAGYALSVMTHSAAVAFSVLGLWAAWRFAEGAGSGAALAAGLLCAAAALTRTGSVLVVLPLGVAIGLRLLRARAGGDLATALRLTALLVGAGALLYAPLLVHNWSTFGSPFLTGQAVTESSGLGLGYWGPHLALLVAQLRDSGLWIVGLAGVAGIAVLAARRPGLAGFLGAWAFGHLALYHSFYWRSGGHWLADLRYYLDVFPPLSLAAVAAAAGFPTRARTLLLGLLALAALPGGVVKSLEVAGLARVHHPGAERIGRLLAEQIPEGAVLLSDESILSALPYYGDWLLYYDPMFHPSYIESYAWLLTDDRPWPISRRRVRRWMDLLGGRSPGELAADERALVQGHLAAGRRVFFVTGGNHRNEWRERLAPAFRIEPRVESRSLYWSQEDPRFPSRRLSIYELEPRAGVAPIP